MSEQLEPLQDLLEAAEEDPEAVDVEEVLPYLDHEAATQRMMALRLVNMLAVERPEHVVEHVEELRPSLEDEVVAPQTGATFVFTALAEGHPEAVLPSVDTLIDLLDEDPPLLRFRAAGALAPLLVDHREEFTDYVEELADVLANGPEVEIPDPTDPDLPEQQRQELAELLDSRQEEFQQDKARSQGVFEFAANALVEVAEIDPELVAPHLDAVSERVDAERPIVRTAVVDTIATVAEHDPAAVEPAIDDLRERLDDDVEYIRAHAVRALGYAEATEAADDVRELADADIEEELQELATDTADWLEAQADEETDD